MLKEKVYDVYNVINVCNVKQTMLNRLDNNYIMNVTSHINVINDNQFKGRF